MASTYTSYLNLRKPENRDPETYNTWDAVVNGNMDLVDAAFGNRMYTEQNYILNSDSHSLSLDKLDMKAKDLNDLSPTANEKAALVGPVGYAPSNINPYVTLSYAAGGYPMARKTILAPEYPGGVLWNGGAVPVGGTLTTDFEFAASGYVYNFYEWYSSEIAYETYNVVVRWKVPETFVRFNTTANKALILDLLTQDTGADSNVMVTIFRDDTLGITSSSAYTASTVADTWYSERQGDEVLAFDATDAVLASLVANDVLVIIIAMRSQNTQYVKIGDITIQYVG